MIEIEDLDGVIHLRVRGRLTERCIQAIARRRRRRSHWVVDLRDADYVDGRALGLLMLLREEAGRAGVRIRGARHQPLEVLLMFGFDRLFELTP